MNSHFFEIEEDFEAAYNSRLNDFLLLKRLRQNNQSENDILMMHLAGIIAECFLKNVILTEGNYTKQHKCSWYKEDDVQELIVNCSNNITKEDIKSIENKSMKNPGHKILEAVVIWESLNPEKGIPDNIRDILKKIEDPLAKGKPTYIDLRYRSVHNEEPFEDWIKNFMDLIAWFANC